MDLATIRTIVKKRGIAGIFSYMPEVTCRGYVEGSGWRPPQASGEACGTVGKSKRLKAFCVGVDSSIVPGGIRYSARVRDSAREDWVNDGEAAFAGRAKYAEVMIIELTGKLADIYDVYYRARVMDSDWTAWVKNGEAAGSPSHAIEAFEVMLAKKGKKPLVASSK
ncbi:MAG: hypothetical protein LBF78_00535 [Treponema sp.]|jgi:uncharacterized protein YjdB|nr:hypothetical protein [Treponema sp.]